MASEGSGMQKLMDRSAQIIDYPQDEFDNEVHPTGLNNIHVGVYRFKKKELKKDFVEIFLCAYWPDQKIGIRKGQQSFENLKKIVERADGKITLEDPEKPIGQLKVFRAIVRGLGSIKRGTIATEYKEAIRRRRKDRARRQERQAKRDARSSSSQTTNLQ